MNDAEKLVRFCGILKSQIRLEVLNVGENIMINASIIALNVDGAVFGSGIYNT